MDWRARVADSRAVRAGTAVVLIGLLAGCGASDFGSGAPRRSAPHSSATPAPPTSRPPIVHRPALRAELVKSAATTRSARTAHTSVSVTVTGLGKDASASGAFDSAGSGVVDLANGDADLVLSVPLFDQLGGVGGGGTIEERIVDGVAYARLPVALMRLGGLAPAVKWLRIDPARGVKAPASTLAQSQVDPTGELLFLAAVSDDVRPVGVEAVRGARTTHYSATVGAASAGALGTARSAVGARLGAVGAAFRAAPMTVDAWIDGAGIARRVVVSLPFSVPGTPVAAGVTPAMSIQADFYGFGSPVRVVAPPAAQVRPFTALRLPGLGG
jgi:hypothetical protein